ncbi:hypothetical protein LTR27_005876 [Elasticomyces elasticus]|nr:hypothetical protein LTR27_005876 [Elasticomyces elasticus]
MPFTSHTAIDRAGFILIVHEKLFTQLLDPPHAVQLIVGTVLQPNPQFGARSRSRVQIEVLVQTQHHLHPAFPSDGFTQLSVESVGKGYQLSEVEVVYIDLAQGYSRRKIGEDWQSFATHLATCGQESRLIYETPASAYSHCSYSEANELVNRVAIPVRWS